MIAAHAVSFLVMRPRPTRVFLLPAALIGGLLLPVALFVATANGDPLAWVDEPGGKVFGRALSRLAGGKFPLLAYCVLGAIGVFVTFRAVRAESAVAGVVPAPAAVHMGCGTRRARRCVQRPGHARVRRQVLHRHPARCRARGRVRHREPPAPHAAGRGVARTRRGLTHRYRPLVPGRVPRGLDRGTAVVAAQAGPDDVVVVLPSIGGSVAEYYACREHDFDLTAEVPDSGGPAVADVLWEMKGPVMSDWPRVKHYPEWRDRYYELVDTQSFKGIVVSRYERRNG